MLTQLLDSREGFGNDVEGQTIAQESWILSSRFNRVTVQQHLGTDGSQGLTAPPLLEAELLKLIESKGKAPRMANR